MSESRCAVNLPLAMIAVERECMNEVPNKVLVWIVWFCYPFAKRRELAAARHSFATMGDVDEIEETSF